MKSRDFCYWLQGFFELRDAGINGEGVGDKTMDAMQVEQIEKHLALVFKHEIDPSQGSPEHQAELQAIHDTKPPQFGGTDSDGNVYRC